ncbi:hypothetical protein EHS25_004321 [Saitozyma podzolica]|uniref:Sm domain-containing protein n=1 Tax=Saitozyma podzolica TaxID=1890683 RepID=A0A427YTQ7_9TREE|nr:hypothetical protein EHS25_004321 [Saitozyma podzolica]
MKLRQWNRIQFASVVNRCSPHSASVVHFPLLFARSSTQLSHSKVDSFLVSHRTSQARTQRKAVKMLMFSFFKTLTDQVITVELKNDLSITGTLKSVDQFLNIRLDGISVEDPERHPHMMAVKNCFIRGSVVRYVRMPTRSVDVNLLEDATRREAKEGKK